MNEYLFANGQKNTTRSRITGMATNRSITSIESGAEVELDGLIDDLVEETITKNNAKQETLDLHEQNNQTAIQIG